MGKIIRGNTEKRTFVAEDVKSILEGTKEVLHLYREILHAMTTVKPITSMKISSQAIQDAESIDKWMEERLHD